jgi:Flp pilus assembly protein TadG
MSRPSVASVLRECSGAVLIEFAFVLPFLLLMITAIVDFGFAFREYLLVTNAAREGARMAILPGYSDGDDTARVEDYLTKAGGVPATMVETEVATEPRETPAGATYTVKTVTVRMNHTFSIMAPFLSGSTLGTMPLKAVSVMRVEVAAEAAP